jgi:hypothetical protein
MPAAAAATAVTAATSLPSALACHACPPVCRSRRCSRLAHPHPHHRPPASAAAADDVGPPYRPPVCHGLRPATTLVHAEAAIGRCHARMAAFATAAIAAPTACAVPPICVAGGHGAPPQVTCVGAEGRGGRGSAPRGPSLAPQLSQHTAHRTAPPCHGGELSASARHLAALRRLPADRRTTPGQEAAPAVAAACLRACVRCRACVSCAARPLTSGCIVIVWSRVCVESCVRCAGARRCSSTSSYATYKVLTVGKVYRPSRTSSLHRRRSRDEAAPGLILIADSAQRWNLFRRAVMRCAFDRRSHSAS